MTSGVALTGGESDDMEEETPTSPASPVMAVKPCPAGAPVDVQPMSEVALGHMPGYLLCCMMFDASLEWQCLRCSKGIMLSTPTAFVNQLGSRQTCSFCL